MTLDIHGIIPPLVSPFTVDEQPDLDALRAEVRYHLDLGVHGLCVTGSTGDGQMLSLEDSVAIARATVEETAGRVPVIAGIIQDSTKEVIRYGKAIAETGVDALQVTPVHYLFQPDEDTTVAYYRRIADETALPIVVYNVIPYALIPATTVARVMNEIPAVIGVKQSGGNIHQLADLLHMNPEGGKVFTAVDDLLFPSYLMGAQGAISATLTVVPELCMAQWDAVQRGDLAAALELHNKQLPVWRAIDGPNMTARIKAALALQGRDGGASLSPLTPVSDAEREALRAALLAADVKLAA
ncbi:MULTISPECIES: dihydrodipicolinate synthase family protein [Pseudonocardia]|uniref:4-hydroxy-tetrahydrodipicolinate synthase n=2 Tax=Pseudonocardia TaxID=1847 RepID=A0A1Y2MMC7_PSEAH|nr:MULTISPECIES: dihydrodipicolinate synthase family protein [Pseudonocardia]OSY36241.1 4-hydroxy-tetrahydrodipicolinate synthase [Pseudonocardia autotrophica]TDN73049.1 4-hydroxy-tetrahydrodipicolinate synthase [Pseudonocardia autotrophica]BBG03767.1 4-hydroxy-tetrahydrodipicolinate synthase [Pseudonocardia autotrophica]GEC26625.1 4-hydroxy-tetrahydrodipicolinate synthase [Pseudonocardia saturnea]